MGGWFLPCVLVLAGCYHGASELDCKVRCSDGCPSGTSCVNGYCTSGTACGPADSVLLIDAAPDAPAPADATACGAIGQACCAAGPACTGNAYCAGDSCAQCVLAIDLGSWYSCALEHDGSVWCVGDNLYGELGDGTNTSTKTGTQVKTAAGAITDAIAIGAGHAHACAVRADHSVWCWGYGADGELGNNANTSSNLAVQVVTAAGPLTDIVEVAGGLTSTCARSSAGAVWCWGYNGDGELGNNSNTSVPYAVQVVDATGQPVAGATAIAAGAYHACELDSSARVFCWGYNNDGRLGDGTMTAPLHAVQAQVGAATAIAAGRRHTCVLTSAGAIECFGTNSDGQLGNGTQTSSATPVTVLASPGGAPFSAIAIAVGGAGSCALDESHRVWCWGSTHHGLTTGSLVPAPILTLDGQLVADHLVVRHMSACEMTDRGELSCWGHDNSGMLADGTATDHAIPGPYGLSCR